MSQLGFDCSSLDLTGLSSRIRMKVSPAHFLCALKEHTFLTEITKV